MSPTPPLAGITVVVTRARAQAGELAAQLEALGASIVEFPTIEVRSIESPEDPGSPAAYDWIVFTSANAVTQAMHAWLRLGHVDAIPDARVCAVGPATRRAAERAGLRVDVVPEVYLAERVPDALRAHGVRLQGARILLPRGNIARPELPEALRDAGALVTEWIVYETGCPDGNHESAEALMDRSVDLVTFTSASTAQNFATLLGPERLARLAAIATFASIGPQTTLAARNHGISIAVEPSQHDVPGLVEAIVAWAGGRRN